MGSRKVTLLSYHRRGTAPYKQNLLLALAHPLSLRLGSAKERSTSSSASSPLPPCHLASHLISFSRFLSCYAIVSYTAVPPFPILVLHESLAGQVLVGASVEDVSLPVFVLLVVLGIPLLLVQRVLDFRVEVSCILQIYNNKTRGVMSVGSWCKTRAVMSVGSWRKLMISIHWTSST